MNIPLKYEDVVEKMGAALGREAALREELDNHDCATLLINAWVDAHGKQIPWDKAIEIIAVATKMPYAEKTRLLCLDDQYELLQQRLTVAEHRAAVMEKALSRIAREHDCGCSPCTGSCTSQVALEITVDAMRDIAIAALKPAEGEVS